MSSSPLDNATPSAAMRSTAVSSASTEPSPPAGLSSTVAMASSLRTWGDKRPQQLLVPSSPSCERALQCIDSTSDGFPDARPSCSGQHNSCALPDTADCGKAILQQLPHATAQGRSGHASNHPGPSPSSCPTAANSLTSRGGNTAYVTLRLGDNDAEGCVTTPVSAAAATSCLHTDEPRARRNSLPAPSMQRPSSAEEGIDAATSTEDITTTWHSSSFVNVGSDVTPTASDRRNSAPSLPLKPQSISLQPEESANLAREAGSRGTAGLRLSAGEGLTTTMTTTATNITTEAAGLPRTMFPRSNDTLPSCSTKAATAAPSGLRREKRRPPSLFSGSPMMTSLTVATRPLLITPAAGRQEDRSLTPSATVATEAASLTHASEMQATSSVSQVSQPLHGQVQPPPVPLLRTPGSLSTSSSTFVPPVLPMHDNGGGEEEAGEGQLSTLAVRRDVHGLVEIRLPMNLTPYPPAHANQSAVLSTTSPPLRSGRPAYLTAAQQHRIACESQEGLVVGGCLTGNTGASTPAHDNAAGASTPAPAASVWTPSSAMMTRYRSFHAGYTSAAATGGAATPNTTPLLSNNGLCGLSHHCGAAGLSSGTVAGSTGGGSAPTVSLSTATAIAGANRLQPPSVARLSVTGVSGGAAAGVLSPLSRSGASGAAWTGRRRAPPPLLFRLRSPVGPAPISTAVGASAETTSPGSAAPPSSRSGTATAAAVAAASAGACSSSLTTPPLNSRSTGMTVNSGSASDVVGTTDRPPRGSGCNPPSTPARSGPLARAHGGLAQNLNTCCSSIRGGSTSGSLVRISHDRRTLVAGMFRVSQDGCLTVRNMLLLNPTRIDAGGTTGGAAGPSGASGSFMGSSTTGTGGAEGRSQPLQLLHPQRCATNYSPVSSNGGLVGRMQLLGPSGGGGGGGGGVGGLGPMTPSTTGSDWYSPHAYHGGGGGLGNARTVHNNGDGGGGAHKANASFTLFSTSMDTPFSPITYSMDSQRLALPSPVGAHHDKASVAAGPPPPLLGTVCEDTSASHFLGVSGSPHQQPHQTEALLPGAHQVAEANIVPTRNLGFDTMTGDPASAAQQQAGTPNSTTTLGHHSGGSCGNFCNAQPQCQGNNGWLPGALGATNATSPPQLATAGGTGSMLGTGAFTYTDTATSLLLPYIDIVTYRGDAASMTAGNCVGSPPGHTNCGGFRTTTTAATAMAVPVPMMGGSGVAQNTSFPPLPPNVVRLPDLEILSSACGEGASATVFVAIHKPTGRRLAVKRVDLSPLSLGCSSPFLRSRAVSNGRISQLQRIVIRELQVLHLTYRSPFMVKVYNAFFTAELAALDIVMEFMHYGSLANLADCLQTHARTVRGSQQERHRLLTGDDDDDDADSDGGGHSGRCGSASGGSPSVPPLPCDTLEAPQLADGMLKDAAGVGARTSGTGGSVGGGGNNEQRSSTSCASPTLLDPRRTPAEWTPPSALTLCQLRAVSTTGGHAVNHTAFDEGGVPSHPVTGCYKHIYDSDDSALLDSYSVKSDCGTDDTESDDGSGLVEEPFGVTERLVAVVGEQLLRGVRDMHSRGYIHQDIKPGNVLVNEHGVVKLSDFGLSQRCDSNGIGIKNDMLTYVTPPSVAPTQSNTPVQSPSLTALHLTGPRGHRAPCIGNTQRGSISAGASGHLGSGMVGTTPPEMGSSAEGLMLSSTITNSVLAQRDGMDVLEAESTSSEEVSGEWDATRRGRGGHSPSSSSSGDADNCCGTDKYMSPERQRGEPYGKPADIWAVGVTLAEFAVGEYPYDLKDVIDEFDRVSRMDRPVNVLQFNKHRAAPLGTVFADFCRLATLSTASQRPTAQELLEHPFFKQWHRPFNLKDYLAARVPVPSNRLKEDYLARQRDGPREGQEPAGPLG